MADIVDDLADLHRQATHEPSHYYAAKTAERAIREIELLRDRAERAEAAMENEAIVTRELRAALKPFAQTGWMTSDTEHTARTVVAHMHPESQYEIILSSEDFRRAARACEQNGDKTNG